MSDDESLNDRLFDEEMEREFSRMRTVSLGSCLLCGDVVSEYDVAYGAYGGEWYGDDIFHSVCLSGRLAISY